MRKVFDAVMDFLLTPWYKMQASKIDALTSDLNYYKDQIRKVTKQFNDNITNTKQLYDENCKLEQENKSIKMVNENLSATANKYQLEFNSAMEAYRQMAAKVKELEDVNEKQSGLLKKATEEYNASGKELAKVMSERDALNKQVVGMSKTIEAKNLTIIAKNKKLSSMSGKVGNLQAKLNKYETRKDTTTN